MGYRSVQRFRLRALALGRPHVLLQPRDQRAGGFELSAHPLVAGRLVQPRLERVALVDGQLLEAQAVDARVVDREAARRSLECRRRELEAARRGGVHRALEPRRATAVAERPAEALELV